MQHPFALYGGFDNIETDILVMMNFWSNSFWSSFVPKPVLPLVRRSLEEFLDRASLQFSQDDLGYICTPERLNQLINYVIVIPKCRDDLLPGDDIHRMMKTFDYSNLSGTVLSRPPIIEKVLKIPNLMSILWKHLSSTRSTVVFDRIFEIMAMSLKYHPEPTLTLMFNYQGFLEDFVTFQLGRIEPAESFLWLLLLMDRNSVKSTIQWLTRQGLMRMLVDKFVVKAKEESNSEITCTIASIIINIAMFSIVPVIPPHIKFPPESDNPDLYVDVLPLVNQLEQTVNMKKFSHTLLSSPTLLSYTTPSIVEYLHCCQDKRALPPLVKIFLENFRNVLCAELLPGSPCGSGASLPRFGLVRINMMKLMVALADVRSLEIDHVLLSSNIFSGTLELMRKYKMNSTIHAHVVMLFDAACYAPEKCIAILKNCPFLDFFAECHTKYSTGRDLEWKMNHGLTLQGLCMRKIQEWNISKKEIPSEIRKKTFGIIKFRNSCHFMGHLAKIAKIIMQQTTWGTSLSIELKEFIENHRTWPVIRQINLEEEKFDKNFD